MGAPPSTRGPSSWGGSFIVCKYRGVMLFLHIMDNGEHESSFVGVWSWLRGMQKLRKPTLGYSGAGACALVNTGMCALLTKAGACKSIEFVWRVAQVHKLRSDFTVVAEWIRTRTTYQRSPVRIPARQLCTWARHFILII